MYLIALLFGKSKGFIRLYEIQQKTIVNAVIKTIKPGNRTLSAITWYFCKSKNTPKIVSITIMTKAQCLLYSLKSNFFCTSESSLTARYDKKRLTKKDNISISMECSVLIDFIFQISKFILKA